jgi:hypothetical protein
LDDSGIIKKPCGPRVSVSRSEPWADHVRTVPTAFRQWPPLLPCPHPWLRCRRFPAHRFPPPRRHRPPPRATFKRSNPPPPVEHPFFLLALCQCRPSHPCPLSASSSDHPSARPSPPRAPPRASAPLRPFQLTGMPPHASAPLGPSGPSPPLLPARRVPPRITSSVSPRPPHLLQSGFFHSGVAPSPLSHRPRTSGSPELAAAAAQ